MNQEIKTKWVAALRSGEYKQGQGVLHAGNAFCCLGVLCDIYGKEKNVEWSKNALGEFLMYYSVGTLPLEVRDWADLAISNPSVVIGKDEISGHDKKENVAALNDSGKYGFEDLATLIEAQL